MIWYKKAERSNPSDFCDSGTLCNKIPY